MDKDREGEKVTVLRSQLCVRAADRAEAVEQEHKITTTNLSLKQRKLLNDILMCAVDTCA